MRSCAPTRIGYSGYSGYVGYLLDEILRADPDRLRQLLADERLANERKNCLDRACGRHEPLHAWMLRAVTRVDVTSRYTRGVRNVAMIVASSLVPFRRDSTFQYVPHRWCPAQS